MQTHLSLAELPEQVWLFLAKFVGAVLGSAVSIVYVLPKGKQEAAIRFLVGIILGITMGPTAGIKIATYFDVEVYLSKIEIALMGSTAASLCAWWALGVVRNLLAVRAKTELTK